MPLRERRKRNWDHAAQKEMSGSKNLTQYFATQKCSRTEAAIVEVGVYTQEVQNKGAKEGVTKQGAEGSTETSSEPQHAKQNVGGQPKTIPSNSSSESQHATQDMGGQPGIPRNSSSDSQHATEDIESQPQTTLSNSSSESQHATQDVGGQPKTIPSNSKHKTTFLNVACSLPISNAEVERIFSQVKLVLTDNRNRLKVEHVNALLMLKINSEVDFTKAVKRWASAKKRRLFKN